MRRAARVDDNQQMLVDALRSMGASVYIIGEPVDLLVGYAGKTCATEVKNPNAFSKGKKKTKQQIEFFAEFKGMAATVWTLEDCRNLLGRMAC